MPHMNLKCVIVDDEPLAIEILLGLIKEIPSITVTKTFNDAVSAIGYVNNENVDFLLLDIEMPNLNGLDFLKGLANPPQVIITSANKEYALEGFDLDVADYILKPVTRTRLLRAIDKVMGIVSQQQEQYQRKGYRGVDKYILLRENKKMVKIDLGDILYIESDRDYVKVITPNRTVITKQNLGYFEKELSATDFLRVHRSFIVSYGHIDAYSSSTVEVSGIEIPFGRLYKDNVLKLLEEYFCTH